MGKYYYFVWLFVLILLFGIFSIPKIFDRISSGSIVEDNRSVPAKPLSYLNIDNEPKKVPEFLMFNQDSLLIGNEDFLGKEMILGIAIGHTFSPLHQSNVKKLLK